MGPRLVKGMSTRKGTVVFLEDILNTAQSVMLDKLNQNSTGKLSEITNPSQTADIIGLSGIMIQDFSAQRNKDYTFTWNKVTSFDGFTGAYLQYAHCRLASLLDKNSDIPLLSNPDYSLLVELEALILLDLISKYQSVFSASLHSLEPHRIVQYLFTLAQSIMQCHRGLKVKNTELHLAQVRKLLFTQSKQILSTGMKLLGLCPLERM